MTYAVFEKLNETLNSMSVSVSFPGFPKPFPRTRGVILWTRPTTSCWSTVPLPDGSVSFPQCGDSTTLRKHVKTPSAVDSFFRSGGRSW